MVNKISNMLKKHGVKKGDRVAIYLPTSPVAIASMLACARIGAIHSVVFAGFSAEALAGRIEDGRLYKPYILGFPQIIKLTVKLDFSAGCYIFAKFWSIISGTKKKISLNKYTHYIILFIHLFQNLPKKDQKLIKS